MPLQWMATVELISSKYLVQHLEQICHRNNLDETPTIDLLQFELLTDDNRIEA